MIDNLSLKGKIVCKVTQQLMVEENDNCILYSSQRFFLQFWAKIKKGHSADEAEWLINYVLADKLKWYNKRVGILKD